MSLYDRDYMRASPYKNKRNIFAMIGDVSAVKVLIIVNVLVFFVGAVIDRIYGYGTFFNCFDLSLGGLLKGKVWTIITYAFLHADLAHIAFNMIALYFVGNIVERQLGTTRFCTIYFAGALLGAIVWLIFSFGDGSGLVGASAAVMAIFATFCVLAPAIPITFLLFFVLPVRMYPMTMLKIAVSIEALGYIFTLLGGNSIMAYSAHLGGIGAGVLCAYLIREGRFNLPKIPSIKKKTKFAENTVPRAKDFTYKVNITDTSALKAEVDRILKKITKEGFASLTEAEKAFLGEASRRMK